MGTTLSSFFFYDQIPLKKGFLECIEKAYTKIATQDIDSIKTWWFIDGKHIVKHMLYHDCIQEMVNNLRVKYANFTIT